MLACAGVLAGCASLAPPAPTVAGRVHPVSPAEAQGQGKPQAATATPVARAEAGALKPFAEVVRGATEVPGYFPLWRKDDKLWIEVPVARLEEPFLLSANIDSSVGERGLYASQMGRSWVASFRRVGSQMQLVARNLGWRAEGSPALQRAIAQGFSDSLLGSGPVVSAEHPERRSVLVDGSFLLGDIAGYDSSIEVAFRIAYSFDRANSSFEQAWGQAGSTSLKVRTHFTTPRIPQASGGSRPPSTTPDPRSFFVGFVYNFLRLPDEPMRPRRADPRIGHFTDAYVDLSTEARANNRVHHINRWRLEKADPEAAVSAPKEPIVFWLDKNIPERYRDAVRAGVLEWNKAFERIGFRDAIVVTQQPDDAEWDTLDARHASIRWYVGADAGTARGPHHSDPRTGEILDADIAMADVFTRSSRRFFVEQAGRTSQDRLAALMATAHEPPDSPGPDCHYAMEAAAELEFALETLVARGDIAPDGPEAEAFVQAVVKDTVMHEVGHTLGLKHNFKASTTVMRQRLSDREFTERAGISGSVMDYNPFNLALAGEPQGAYNNTTLGSYDYWAIEYAYRPLPPEREAEELARIAARGSGDPALAYGDDYDAGGFAGFEGIDPTANRFDLGDDPLAYAERRMRLTQELWQRTQLRPATADDPARQRRVLLGGFRQLDRTIELAGKYVGGMVQVRDVPGSGARRTYTPVEPARQRQALQLLTRQLFSADSFRFRPEFLSSLPPDYLDRESEGPVSIPDAVLRVQSMALDRLLGGGTANRLLDLPHYLSPQEAAKALSLAEVYGTVQDAVWAELKTGGEIDRLRRNLQREHLRRVVQALTRGSGLPPDAVSLLRFHAQQLQGQLQQALSRRGLSIETQAHLQDSAALLQEALRATLQRG